MKLNHKKIYNKFINKYQIFGIESDFHDYSRVTGPVIPAWIKEQTIYEIYVRAFSEEGTFKGVQKNLKYIKSLGIDIIWFMPIYPIGKTERKGRLGCPYSVQNYFNVNPEYGTNTDFKNLVETAHNSGMRVIIDLVVNHVAHDYVGFEKHPELALRDNSIKPTRKVADWADVVDLDYGNKDTWNHVLEIMQYWIEIFDIDGYRCDVAGLVPTKFWEWIIPQIQSLKKDIFMLAEWESPLLHKKVFHSTYDWIFYSIVMDVVIGNAPASNIADWIETKKYIYPKNSLFLRFLENHDKVRAAKLFNKKQLAALLILIFSIDGIPLIYNGQEIGIKHYPSLFEKETINWKFKNLQIHKLTSELILLRKNYHALGTKNYKFIGHTHSRYLLVYKKYHNNTLLVIINFSTSILDISKISELNRLSNYNLLLNTHPNYSMKSFQPYQAIILLEK